MIFRINFFANSMVQLFYCDMILLIYTANQSTNQQPSRRRLQRNFRYSGIKIKCLCSIKHKKNIEGSSLWFVFYIYSYQILIIPLQSYIVNELCKCFYCFFQFRLTVHGIICHFRMLIILSDFLLCICKQNYNLKVAIHLDISFTCLSV